MILNNRFTQSLAAIGVALLCMACGVASAQSLDASLEQHRITLIEKLKPTVVLIYGEDVRQGGGSGVLISDTGLALTNFHVIAPAGMSGWAGRSNGMLYRWRLIGMDPGGDLALIQLETDEKLPCATFGDSDSVRVGQWTLAMGNPFVLAGDDQQPTVTQGIVSGVDRYQGGAGGNLLVYGQCIQVDTSINPGNSGGPLFNFRGALIGINGRASFEERGRVNVGVGYAISIKQVKMFLGDLLAGKVAQHGKLDATFATHGSGENQRVIMDAIERGSPIDDLGIGLGDQLLAIDDTPIAHVNAMVNLLSTMPAGWPIALTWREAKTQEEYDAVIRLSPVAYDVPEVEDLPEGVPEDALRDNPLQKQGQVLDEKINREMAHWLLMRWAKYQPKTAEALNIAKSIADAERRWRIVGSDRYAGRNVVHLQLTRDAAVELELWINPFRAGARRGPGLLPRLAAWFAEHAPTQAAEQLEYVERLRLDADNRHAKFGPYPLRRPYPGEMPRPAQMLPSAPVPPIPAAIDAQLFEQLQQRCVKIHGAAMGREQGYATGILVSGEGDILTAPGVYTLDRRTTITLADGTQHRGTLIDRNPHMGIAHIRIDAKTPHYFALEGWTAGAGSAADDEQFTFADMQWVMAVGNWFNVATHDEPMSAALGWVSLQTRLDVRKRAQPIVLDARVILTDAITSNPGAAGSALVNLSGELVGMVGRIVESRSTSTRLNYAISVEELARYYRGELEQDAEQQLEVEQVKLADMGIALFTLTGADGPAYIDRVRRRSPAHRAGLRKDDLILKINEQVIPDIRTYRRVMDALGNPVVRVMVKRGDRVVEVTVDLTEP